MILRRSQDYGVSEKVDAEVLNPAEDWLTVLSYSDENVHLTRLYLCMLLCCIKGKTIIFLSRVI